MREILFRGKRIDSGEWVCGSFCMDAREQFNGLCCVDGFIRLYNKAEGKMQMHEVDRETVGQFTGLTDKNGKKIFEGDICKHRSNYSGDFIISVVTYTDGCFLAMADNNSGFNLSKKLEIIGNIHDNPELLGGANHAEEESKSTP